MTYVIPKFVDFYAAFGAELPLPTRLLIGTSNLITRWWPVILAILAGIGFGFRRLLGTPGGRLWFDSRLTKIPAIGDIIVKSNVARFALMFRILFNSGIPVVKTLEILATVVKNVAISGEIHRLGEHFRKGRGDGLTGRDFQLFPDLALNMMAIGMESGSVDSMMAEVGEHYTKEVMYRSRHLTSILEPLLTVVLGVFILIVALAVFLPMWNLIRVFNGS